MTRLLVLPLLGGGEGLFHLRVLPAKVRLGLLDPAKLVMLAFALLARVRHQANAPAPPKTIQRLIALTHPN